MQWHWINETLLVKCDLKTIKTSLNCHVALMGKRDDDDGTVEKLRKVCMVKELDFNLIL